MFEFVDKDFMIDCVKSLTDLEILPVVNFFCQDLSIFCQLIQILPVQ